MDLEGKNLAYWERNQLVCYLSRIYPSWLEKHPIEDSEWESEWRNIVFIEFPQGAFSWHIHDSEMKYFVHLEFKEGNSWDGSTTIQKYDRLMDKDSARYFMTEMSQKEFEDRNKDKVKCDYKFNLIKYEGIKSIDNQLFRTATGYTDTYTKI